MTCREVIDEIMKSIESAGAEISEYTEISFPLQRDPNVTSRELACVKEFAESVQTGRDKSTVFGFAGLL